MTNTMAFRSVERMNNWETMQTVVPDLTATKSVQHAPLVTFIFDRLRAVTGPVGEIRHVVENVQRETDKEIQSLDVATSVSSDLSQKRLHT